MVSTVVFDVDETLVDLRPAVREALLVVLAEMRRLSPAAQELSLADLEADAASAFEEHRAEPVETARREAFGRSLARIGLGSHLDCMAELYFTHRFAATHLYGGVPRLLNELRRSYVVGLGSNGNNHAGRLGLAGEFAFEVYAHVNGVPKKPAAGFFEAVIAAAGCPPQAIVHVGNTWEQDVVGAAALGLRMPTGCQTRRSARSPSCRPCSRAFSRRTGQTVTDGLLLRDRPSPVHADDSGCRRPLLCVPIRTVRVVRKGAQSKGA